ncbi:MAG TPA: hypothetical protein VKA18_09475 [Alphaproteobacteria bacterium]|nr:hypothetical protein [Alphaproteobacteria bacterium]
MFGFSFGKLLVLAVVLIGAWRFFKWLEARGDRALRSQNRSAAELDQNENPSEVELEEDPETGVWRPKKRD